MNRRGQSAASEHLAGLARRRIYSDRGQELKNHMFFAVVVVLKPSTGSDNITDQIQFYLL